MVKVWILLVVSFVVVSLFMGFVNWASVQHTLDRHTEKRKRDGQVSDYLGKYFLYNVNVLTTHGTDASTLLNFN